MNKLHVMGLTAALLCSTSLVQAGPDRGPMPPRNDHMMKHHGGPDRGQQPPMKPDMGPGPKGPMGQQPFPGPMMPPAPGPDRFGPEQFGPRDNMVEFTTDQKIQQDKLMAQFMDKNAEPKARLDEAQKNLGDLLKARPLDKKAIMALQDKISGYQKILFENKLDLDIALYNLLTDEQKDKLAQGPKMAPPPAMDCQCPPQGDKNQTADEAKGKKNKKER